MMSEVQVKDGSNTKNCEAPYGSMRFKKPGVNTTVEDDGSILLTSTIALAEPDKSIPHLFKRRVTLHPERAWLAEKNDDGNWSSTSYEDFDKKSDQIAQWLLDRQLGQESAIMILSENSIAHALFSMGAMKARVPSVPVSTAYSLRDRKFTKLKKISDTVKPRIVFADSIDAYGDAFKAIAQPGTEFVVCNMLGQRSGVHLLDDLFSTAVGSAVSESIEAIEAETVAKYLFTSGSTGAPKGVVHTQGAMCAQNAAIWSIYDPDRYYQDGEAPVSLQWMPWSHVAAGNISYNESMLHGGTIYIDDGRPMPGLFEKTIKNLQGISPSVFGSAPLGFSWLADALEADSSLRKSFFKKVEMLVSGGAALPDAVFQRFQRLSILERGEKIPFISMYGATETHGITVTYWASEEDGLIGLPIPGVSLKLVPCGSKLEVRVKGATVFSEYKDDPVKTRDAFDGDGYFSLGDAAKFVDANEPVKGLVFDGRTSEDFKLLSGTWVSAGMIRTQVLSSCSNLLRDAVVCGENREYIGLLAWINSSVANGLIDSVANGLNDNVANGLNDGEAVTDEALITHPVILAALEQALKDYNVNNGSTSTRVKHIRLLLEAPSLEMAEITEKGYINPANVIKNRAEDFNALYEQVIDANKILI
jgi:feruloyl-CoA synthase